MDQKLKDCYQLWKTCFMDSKRYRDFYFDKVTMDNRVLTLYEKDTLTSMLHLNPYTVQLGNEPRLLHYIVGVATDPAYRRQGRMRRLMEEAFRYLEKNQEPLTYLMPEKESIYLPFGFRFAYTQNRIWINVSKIECNNGRDYRLLEWEQCKESQKDDVCAYANEALKTSFNVYAAKTPKYYNRLREEMKAAGGDLFVLYRKDGLVGVVSYMCENGELEVTETICERDASEAMMRETYYHASSNKKDKDIRSFVFLESAFLGIPDRYITKVEKKPIIMMRVINVQDFLARLPGREGEERVLRVKDEWIPGNNGTYRVSWNQTGARVERMDEQTVSCRTRHIGDEMTVEEVFRTFQDRLNVYINEIV